MEYNLKVPKNYFGTIVLSVVDGEVKFCSFDKKIKVLSNEIKIETEIEGNLNE